MQKKELTANQLKTINQLLENNSIEEAARKARLSRGTVYNWLKQELFRNQLEKERKALFEEGLNTLKGATAKAAKTLINLLESKDENTKRLAAKEIINVTLKVTEIRNLEERVSQLEDLVEQSNEKDIRVHH